MATSPFTDRVLVAVRRIPPGRASAYGDIAALAGRPRAARAVGTIMRNCGSAGVPCHRVVAAGGRLGGFGGNTHLKRALLVAEGIIVAGTRLKNWGGVRWTGPGPLARSRNSQALTSVSPGRRRPAK